MGSGKSCRLRSGNSLYTFSTVLGKISLMCESHRSRLATPRKPGFMSNGSLNACGGEKRMRALSMTSILSGGRYLMRGICGPQELCTGALTLSREQNSHFLDHKQTHGAGPVSARFQS